MLRQLYIHIELDESGHRVLLSSDGRGHKTVTTLQLRSALWEAIYEWVEKLSEVDCLECSNVLLIYTQDSTEWECSMAACPKGRRTLHFLEHYEFCVENGVSTKSIAYLCPFYSPSGK